MADTVKTEGNQHDMYPLYMLLTMGGVGVLLGLTPLLLTVTHKKSSGALRGRFLSSRVCASCPVIRDCLQNCGTVCRIKWLSLGARDSLESIGSFDGGTDDILMHYDKLRNVRRQNPTIIGVRPSTVIRHSAPTGYKWKKKWKDRRKRSKLKRKLKNQNRKMKKIELEMLLKASGAPPFGITGDTRLGGCDNARPTHSSASIPLDQGEEGPQKAKGEKGQSHLALVLNNIRRFSSNVISPTADSADSIPKT